MQDAPRSLCGLPDHERSLLPPPSRTSAESGLPLMWLEVSAHESRVDIVTERDVLLLMDGGGAQLDCGFGLRAVSCELRAGSMGLFGVGTQLRDSRWRWVPSRRIALDLQQLDARSPGLLDTLRRRGRHAELEFHDPELAALLRGMAREAAEGQPHGALFADSLMMGLAARLIQRATNGSVRQRERGRLSAAQQGELDAWISEHISQRLTLADMAQALGFSSAQFVRLLKGTNGLTPHAHVSRLRLARAHELVLLSRLPLAAIAAETGFSSQSHMTTQFVRRWGTPPGALRRSGHAGKATHAAGITERG